MLAKNAGALMNHVMKQRRLRHNALRLLSEREREPAVDRAGDERAQMTETRIYIGLNDSETREQKYETETYVSLLKEVCRSYQIAFSMDIEEGGYYHEDGEYTEETSLVLILIDAEQNTVHSIAEKLCALFHQESVLVTEDKIHGRFISSGQV